MLTANAVTYEYRNAYQTVRAVDGVSWTFQPGQVYAIVGASGSGKTTLLSLLAGLDVPTSGSIALDGETTAQMDRDAYRLNHISVIYQNFNLFAHLTALENVELALQICRNPLDAKEVLKEVGLESRMKNFPAQLSGGEQQRVAIARALAKNPRLLLCDEPTGALDYVTGKAILKLLHDTCRTRNMTVIVITHNTAITPMADRVIHIHSGKVKSMEKNEHPQPIEQIEW